MVSATELRVGVVGLQGAVSEHVRALDRAFQACGLEGRAALLRTPADLAACDGVVLPGGESTTISRLLRRFGLQEPLLRRAREEDLPILGTCAGLILLAKEGDAQVQDTETELLGLIDIAVDRNAFGRQRESFEADVALALGHDTEGGASAGGEAPFHAVFIRGPAVTRVWGAARPVSRLGDTVVGVRQGNRIALCFHPELTPDTRVHEAFLRTVAAWKASRRAAAPEAEPGAGAGV